MSSSSSIRNSPRSGDELDWVALIKTLWAGKWRVAITCFLAVLVGLFSNYRFNKMIIAELSIGQLNQIEMADFKMIEDLKVINELNSRDLVEEFEKHLSSFENVKSLVEQYGLLDDSESGKDYQQQIANFTRSRIQTKLVISRTYEGPRRHINLKMKGKDRDRLRNILESLVSMATEQQRSAMLRDIENTISNLEKKQAFQVKKTQLKIDASKDKYFKKKADRIEVLEGQISTLRRAYLDRKKDIIRGLKEQTAIAHSLGIEKPLEIQYDQIPQNAIITQFNSTQQPLYLRGYLALEKEIELVENREQDDGFIPGLRELERELLEITGRKNDEAYIPELRDLQETLFLLENDPTLVQAKTAVNEMIRNNPDLHFVYSNIDSASFRRLSLAKILIAALSIGLAIGVLWVLISAAIHYRNEDSHGA